MKRLLAGTVIFLILLALIMLPSIIAIYRFSRGGASGIGFVIGSPLENVFRVFAFLLLVLLSYWLSGKLVRS